jgi:hypothetical protein
MRYFLAFLITLGLIFSLFLLLFHGSSKPKTPAGKTLDSYSTTDATVRMTIGGPINADQNHNAIRITVGSNDVTYEQLRGYQGNAVNVQSFANNSDAYANFLLALSHAGFTQGSTPASYKDERGYCPLGARYVFELNQDGQEIERYWATNCGKPKTYLGALNLTITLFQAQVPGYSNLTQNIAL